MQKTSIDQAILDEYQLGKENVALQLLIKNYKVKLYWHIRRIILDHDNSDDVLQNTFIKVWKGLANFKGESQLYTWLFKIATNEALTFIEKNKKSTLTDSLSQNVSLENQFSSSNDFNSDDYSGDAIQLKLEKAIATLPEKQRAVFHLKYYEELKYEEISEIMTTSVGALKANYHHAVKKIELFLEND
jgi:RNA polymerase sigma factor (sigma-70 family)